MKRCLIFFLGLVFAGQSWAENFEDGGLRYTVTDAENHYVSVEKGSTEPTGDLVIPPTVTYAETEYAVTSIGNDAFVYCSGLTSVSIPNSVTSIGNYAFQSCSGLTLVSIGNSVTSIGNYAFGFCHGLTLVSIPNSVTSIGNSAFYSCSGLTSVSIGNSVTSIGDCAFGYCSGLTSVSIPKSVTSIGRDAFYRVKNIVYLGNATGSPWGALTVNGTIVGDFIYTDANKTQLSAYIGNGGSVTIPGSVTSIGNSAFYSCSGLTSVSIPNSVASIGDDAFYKCSGLTSVSIPNSVTSIGNYAFGYCSGLTSVSIPKSVTSIGSSAFYRVKNIVYSGNATGSPWEALTVNGTIVGDFIYTDANKTQLTAYIGNGGSVTIPGSVTSIGNYAFYSCSGLTSVSIGNSVTSIGNYAFYDCDSLTSVSIPNSVTSIGDNAFYNCDSLTSVSIPNSVTSIGNYAFGYCRGLTSVSIGNSVTSIGNEAFYGCSGLTSVSIPNSVTSIGYSAFYSVKNIVYSGNATGSPWGALNVNGTIVGDFIYTDANKTQLSTYIGNGGSVTIPGSVTSIGDNAFYNCDSLTSVSIPNSVTSIGYYAFGYCRGLTSVSIPKSVTSIGYYAFYNCSGLTSVTIPNSVTSIGNYAFGYCSGLTSVSIPNSVTSIGGYAFNNCSNLTINCVAESKPAGWDTNWNYSNCSVNWSVGGWEFDEGTGTLTVQIDINKESEENYPWHSFRNSITKVVFEDGVSSIGSYALSNCGNLTDVVVSASVETIGATAFSNCGKLKYNEYENALYLGNAGNPYIWLMKAKSSGISSCTINANCMHINRYAFENCNNLTSIDIPNSVTTIGEKAFYNCGGLREVSIPKPVTTIESQAFNNANISFYCEPTSRPSGWYCYYSSGYGTSSDWNSNRGTCYWGVSFDIDGLAYYITGQDSVDVVKYTNNDTAIVIPSTVTYSGTTYKVTGIKELAFENRNNLKTITIPNSVARIAALAFVEANKLETINVDAANANYTSVDGVLFNKDKTTLVCYPASNNKNVDYTIPSTVTTIESGAFYKCNTLNSIYIPYNVTNVGYYAISAKIIYCEPFFRPAGWNNYWRYSGDYYWSTRRTGDFIYTITEVDDDEFVAKLRAYTGDGGNVVIPTQITVREVAYEETDYSVIDVSTESKATYPVVSIESEVFRNCEGLTSVSIGESVTEINSSAFSNCTGLTSAYIGSSVKSISGYAFYNCSSLKTVTIPASVTFINTNAFNKCDSITTLVTNSNAIGSVFSNKSLLTTVSIGDSVTTIPDNAFKNCTALSSVSIPNSVTSIGESAFENCIELSSITIPKGVTSIGASAFKDCINLDIYCQAKVKYSGWDDNWNISECPVHMGANLFVVKATPNNAEWGTVTGSGNYMAGNEVRLMATASAGYRFVKWSDNNTDNPRVEIVDSDLTLSAVFEKVASATKFTVVGIANNAAFGSVTGTATYNYGDTATLAATANAGYRFVKWNDDNIANPRKVVVTDHLNLTAIFEVDNSTPASFMIVVVANNAAYGTTTGTAVYEAGTEAIISAVAAAGCYFAKWSDGNTDNPRKITVSSDLTITAIFAKDGEKPEDPGTAVEDEVAVAVNIYAYRNTIVVENADAEILVYNAMGRLVATSSDENAEIRVNGSGVYVVRVGNEAKRVMVNE